MRDALSTFLLPAGPTCTALCGAYEEASAAGSALEVAASRPLPSLASLSCQLLVERASWQAGGVRSDVPRPFVEATVRTRHRERGASSYSLRLSLPEFKARAATQPPAIHSADWRRRSLRRLCARCAMRRLRRRRRRGRRRESRMRSGGWQS